MTKKHFEFPLRTVKAFEKDGVKHIIAVASDNKIDLYHEYFAITALGDMVKNCNTVKENKPQEGLVDLQETHHESFGFGFSDRGWLNHQVIADDSDLYELNIDFALKEGHACGLELYDEIKNNQVVKQLSVGGYIENWDDDTEWDTITFTDDEGNEVEIPVLKIKHFYLEHVAVTPGGWAVNPRTRFEDVKSQNLGFMASIYKSLAFDGTQETDKEGKDGMINKTQSPPKETKKEITLAELPSIIMTKMVELFKERDDKVAKGIEKAKNLVKEIKGLELTEDELKELNLSFVSESSEEGTQDEPDSEDTEDSPNVEEVVGKALEPIMEIIKGLQAKNEEDKSVEVIEKLEKSFTDKFDVLEKSAKDKDSVIEELKSKIEVLGNETQNRTDEPEDDKVNKGKDDSEDEPIERTSEDMWEV